MRIHPREFPSGRRKRPTRHAEKRVYEALAGSGRRGFIYYEWRRGYEHIELDFAVWIVGLSRFALQVKGGHYLLIEGEWYLTTKEGAKAIDTPRWMKRGWRPWSCTTTSRSAPRHPTTHTSSRCWSSATWSPRLHPAQSRLVLPRAAVLLSISPFAQSSAGVPLTSGINSAGT